MGCTISSGQLAVRLSDNLQCGSSDDTQTIVFNHTGGVITIIDDTIAKMLGFSFNNEIETTPYVTHVGIAPSTTVKLKFVGMADFTDPKLYATVNLVLDDTGNNVLLSGEIKKTDDDSEDDGAEDQPILISLPQITDRKFAHIVDDVSSKFSPTYTFSNSTTGTYTFNLKKIKFVPTTEHYNNKPNSVTTQPTNYKNYLLVFLIIVLLVLIYSYYKMDNNVIKF